MKQLIFSAALAIIALIGLQGCAVDAVAYPDDYYYYGPPVRARVYSAPPVYYRERYYYRNYQHPRYHRGHRGHGWHRGHYHRH